ncbi:MAG: CDP-diacylglycerol--serine O-phosphatidyltransferase [Bacteroidales bacterium]|jgi:CDP-diacylglycerol--serine O-phosphatidyltransferase|nr:CDP-diacylglycerol--serine O-phosphatidyltransferase [Bacteroidales bacterium]
MKKHLPNLITSLNLAAGFIAVVLAAEGKLLIASWLILTAMIFDFLDGFTARLLKAYSPLGKELDSLADMVSFGVAPALIIYKAIGTAQGINGPVLSAENISASSLVLLIPLIMPVCAGLRLAKFNIDTTQSTTFKGLPTPANALAVISAIIAQHFSHGTVIDQFFESEWALALFSVIISLLMVTRIPMLSLKTTSLSLKGNEARYLLVVTVILSIVLMGISGVILIIPLYIAISLLEPLPGRIH